MVRTVNELKVLLRNGLCFCAIGRTFSGYFSQPLSGCPCPGGSDAGETAQWIPHL